MAKASNSDTARYLKKPKALAKYLTEAFGTGNEGCVVNAIGTVARAKGMSKLARETGLDRPNLYRMFKKGANPKLSTILKVLDSLSMQLVVTPKKKSAA